MIVAIHNAELLIIVILAGLAAGGASAVIGKQSHSDDDCTYLPAE